MFKNLMKLQPATTPGSEVVKTLQDSDSIFVVVQQSPVSIQTSKRRRNDHALVLALWVNKACQRRLAFRT